jgi:hypothetical protein
MVMRTTYQAGILVMPLQATLGNGDVFFYVDHVNGSFGDGADLYDSNH